MGDERGYKVTVNIEINPVITDPGGLRMEFCVGLHGRCVCGMGAAGHSE
jgi:hypothetical protein